VTTATATTGRPGTSAGSVTPPILRRAPAPRTLPVVSLACCYVPFSTLVTHVGTHASKHVSTSAGGSIWATGVPTWITAIATVGLLVGAVIGAKYAIKAFGKQSEQLEDQRKINAEQTKVIGLQTRELEESRAERKREAEQRRRAQASRVFIWQEYRKGNPAQYETPPDYIAHLGPLPHGESRPLMVAHVKNTSDQPVYDLMVRWTLGAAFHSESRRLKPLMPDEENIQLLLMRPGEDFSLFRAVAFFRDAAGVRWRSRPDGQFDEIPPDQPDQEQENTPGG
jgi:hypothetical protein